MPKVTVYIRKEDYPKWQAVKEKTEFISNALNDKMVLPKSTRVQNPDLSALANHKSLNRLPIPTDVETFLVPPVAKNIPRNSPGGLCKHGFPPTFCKFSKPGKPCK